MTAWSLVYDRYDPDEEGRREALCTVGNGYLATRGAAPESCADGVHYPGTYVAGVFNRLAKEVEGRSVENESLVNLPSWLPLSFRIDDGPWFDLDALSVEDYHQELDLRRGVLLRRVRVRDDDGRTTTVTQRRFASMAAAHRAGLETTITAEDWDGRVLVRSGVDAGGENGGVARYADLPGDHLEVLNADARDEETLLAHVRTRDSRVEVAVAARTRVLRDGEPVGGARDVVTDDGLVAHELEVDLTAGGHLSVDKAVAVFTSRDAAIYEPVQAARTEVADCESFADELGRHVLVWRQLWDRQELRLGDDGDADDEVQRVLNLHLFHLLQTVSENTIGLDVGIPARGLHGEAYRGHILWDELFAFAYLDLRLPELSRNLLRYRHRRLPAARRAAKAAGHAGAMYPWQSASDGRETSQSLHLNPDSGRWIPDNSQLQRHIGIAVAHNVWRYVETTADTDFLAFYGAEMLLEIARFWSSLATLDATRDRYVIRGVMGPDEFHDAYPWRDEPGIDNNAYTNVMAVWVLRCTLTALERLPSRRRAELLERLHVDADELVRWEDLTRRMLVPFHDDVISQFEGYERLDELDWEGLRARHGDLKRLDRILEAEDDTPNRYRASKQADVLMLCYLLGPDELHEILRGLGYEPDEDLLPRTVAYYLDRTTHGSTLSRLVHSWVLARLDRGRSYEFFRRSLRADIDDVQGGTTEEGIHLGAMAGTVDLVQRGYTGLRASEDVLELDPYLPDELPRLRFTVRFRGAWDITIDITQERVLVDAPQGESLRVRVQGRLHDIAPGGSVEVALTR